MATATAKRTKPHSLNATQIANVKKWVKALRSGKYEQGTGRLCCDGKYCCLGVACDLLAAPLNVSRRTHGGTTYFAGISGVLPGPIRGAIGLIDEVGTANGTPLVELNDDAKWSFKRIATFIEKQLATNSKGLFKK